MEEYQLTAEDTAAVPDTAQRHREAVPAMSRHGGLGDLQGLSEGGDLEHIEPGAQQQVAELDGLLLELGGLGGRGGDDSGGHDEAGVAVKGALTKGRTGASSLKRGRKREREVEV